MKVKLNAKEVKNVENINICMVIRTYDDMGDFEETRKDNIATENIPPDIMKVLISGELIRLKLMPNVGVFYFEKPKSWPDNWSKLGSHNTSSN